MHVWCVYSDWFCKVSGRYHCSSNSSLLIIEQVWGDACYSFPFIERTQHNNYITPTQYIWITGKDFPKWAGWSQGYVHELIKSQLLLRGIHVYLSTYLGMGCLVARQRSASAPKIQVFCQQGSARVCMYVRLRMCACRRSPVRPSGALRWKYRVLVINVLTADD